MTAAVVVPMPFPGLHGEPWMDGASCASVDPELFFPEKGGTTTPAKKVCRACDVKAPCLRFALDNGERFGIWGGTSERERRRMETRRRAS